jgi:hypothetical protein
MQAHFTHWWPLLTGLAALIGDARIPVRSSSQSTCCLLSTPLSSLYCRRCMGRCDRARWTCCLACCGTTALASLRHCGGSCTAACFCRCSTTCDTRRASPNRRRSQVCVAYRCGAAHRCVAVGVTVNMAAANMAVSVSVSLIAAPWTHHAIVRCGCVWRILHPITFCRSALLNLSIVVAAARVATLARAARSAGAEEPQADGAVDASGATRYGCTLSPCVQRCRLCAV